MTTIVTERKKYMKFSMLDKEIEILEGEGPLLITCSDTKKLKSALKTSLESFLRNNLDLNTSIVTNAELSLMDNLEGSQEIYSLLIRSSNVESLGNEGITIINSIIDKRTLLFKLEGLTDRDSIVTYNQSRSKKGLKPISNEGLFIAGLSRIHTLYPKEVKDILKESKRLGITIISFCDNREYISEKGLDNYFDTKVVMDISVTLRIENREDSSKNV